MLTEQSMNAAREILDLYIPDSNDERWRSDITAAITSVIDRHMRPDDAILASCRELLEPTNNPPARAGGTV